MIVRGNASENYHIYDFLGNNGRLILMAQQGVKISKTIDNPNDQYAGAFTFVIELTAPEGTELPQTVQTMLVDAEENEISGTTDVVEGKLTVSLKNNETLYVAGLAAGTLYTVEEQFPLEVPYRVLNVTAEEVADEVIAKGTVDANQFDEVDFVNTASSRKGNLQITKTVTHPYGESYELDSDLLFEVVVTLSDVENGKTFEATGTVSNGTAVTEVTVVNGKISFEVGHEDSLIIHDIPEDTQYTVEEILEEDTNWIKSGEVILEDEKFIESDKTALVELVNHLDQIVEVDVSNIDIEITKTLTGRDWNESDAFTFIVERYDNEQKAWVNIGTSSEDAVVITDETDDHKTVISGTKTVEGQLVPRIAFHTVGRYFYRVSEVAGSITGVTYDATHRYFYIDVKDEDTDGVLELEVSDYSGTEVITSEGKTVVAANFTNHYRSAVAEINIAKLFTNQTGIEVGMENFEFVLADHTPDKECTLDDGHTHVTVKPNAGGSVMIPLLYTKTDLNGATTGTFTYYIWEKAGTVLPSSGYDSSVYKAVITVSENADLDITVDSIVLSKGEQTVSGISFLNKYELGGAAKVSVPIEKVLTGRNISANDSFTFELYKTASNFSTSGLTAETVSISGDGTSSNASSEIELHAFNEAENFDKAGTYYFVLREQKGNNPAVTYDGSVYHITVQVGANNENSSLEVKNVLVNLVGGQSAELEQFGSLIFENSYRILQNASVTLKGDKDLTGKTITDSDQFKFEIESLTSDAPMPSSSEVLAAAPSGSFQFAAITYQNPGVYEYIIREVIPQEAVNGVLTKDDGSTVDYDSTEYKVTVTVTDNGQGVLSANVEGAEAVKFVNEYEYGSVSIAFDAKKTFVDEATIEPLPFRDGDFQFVLYRANQNYTVQGQPIVTLGNGFSYDGERVTENPSNAEMISIALNYDKPGTYYYVLQEVSGSDHTIRYDSRVYHVLVSVTDYGSGSLDASVFITQGGNTMSDIQGSDTKIEFRNVHTVNYVDEDIPIRKYIENDTGILVPMNMFAFGLYEMNAAGDLILVQKDGTDFVVNASASGDATIHIQFNDRTMGPDEERTYEYYIKEIIPENTDLLEGITYDKSVYKAVIHVEYDADKSLKTTETFTRIADAEGNEITPEEVLELEFTNKYAPVEILDKDVHLSKETFSVDGRTVSYGDLLTYEIIYTNPSFNETVASATIIDQIPEGTVFVSADNDGVYENNTITWSLSNIEAGQSRKVSFEVRVIAGAGAEFTNQAHVEIGENTYYSNETYNNVVTEKDVVSLDGQIQMDGQAVLPNDILTYQIVYVNPSDTLTAEKVTITDYVPNGTEYVEGSANLGGIYENDTVTWVLENVEPNGRRTVTFSVKVVQRDAAMIYNQANVIISGNKYTTNEVFNYVVEKEVSQSHVNVGDTVTYTINYINYENTSADIIVTDQLAPGLTVVNVQNNGLYDSSNHSIVWTIENVPTKTAGSVSFTAKINDQAAEVIENTAEVQVGNNPSVHTNPIEVSLLKSAQLVAYKQLEGRELAEGEFEFELYQTNSAFEISSAAIQRKKNAADGSIVFDEMEFNGLGSYYFVIKEVKGTLGGVQYDESLAYVTIALTQSADGVEMSKSIAMNGSAVQDAIFTNTYDLKDDAKTEVVLSGRKVLEGRQWKDTDSFEFELYSADAEYAVQGEALDSATVSKQNHEFVFDKIEYTDRGIHYFIIKEVKQSIGGVAYDEHVYHIQVNVTDDGQGNLIHEILVDQDANQSILFTNIYQPEASPFTLLGNKLLDGRPLNAGEFTFILYESDSFFTHRSEVSRTVNRADGTFDFTIEGKMPGTYYYVIEEESGSINGVTYDQSHYHITVTVRDDTDGHTTAQAVYEQYSNTSSGNRLRTAQSAEFINTYKATDNVLLTVTGTKALEGRDAVNGEFSFELYETGSDYVIQDGAQPTLRTVNHNGEFKFEGLTYQNKDEVHYYAVKEVKGTAKGITYSTETLTFKVVVRDDLNGELVAEVFNQNNEQISNIGTITNSYLAESSNAVLNGSKSLYGREWTAEDEFIFELYKANEQFAVQGEALLSRTARKDSTSFTFAGISELSFNKAGTHYFVMKEVAGTIGGIKYDATEFGVKIVVTDNLDGTVTPTVHYYAHGSEVSSVHFNNIYELNDDATVRVILSGTKQLTGRSINDGEFTFVLYDETGTAISTANNVGNQFVFDAVTITKDQYQAIVDARVNEYKDKVIAEAEAKAEEEARLIEEALLAQQAQQQEELSASEPALQLVQEELSASEPALQPVQEELLASEPVPQPVQEESPASEPAPQPVQEESPASEPALQLVQEESPASEPVQLLTVIPTADEIEVPQEVMNELKKVQFSYVIREETGTAGGVTYDKNSYNVVLTVYDAGNGTLAHEMTVNGSNEQIVFKNNYTVEPSSVVISGTKKLDGRNLNPEEFTFVLYESNSSFADRTNPREAKNTESGSFSFDVSERMPGTYYFVLEEKAEALGGVVYDKTHYHIAVSVSDNLDGTSSAQITSIEKFKSTETGVVKETVNEIVFENKYKAVDNFGLTISGIKKLVGREQINGEFTFELYAAQDETYTVTEGSVPVRTAHNLDGGFSFDELKFEKTGVYYYVVKEMTTAAAYMTYDSYQYHIKVTVTDPGKGELDASYEVVNQMNSNEMVFTNVYHIIENQFVELTGTKDISGREWLDTDVFTFMLYETNEQYDLASESKLLDTAQATYNQRSFVFDKIEYSAEDVHYYIIKEASGSIGGITYDNKEVHVKVTVTDNHDGTLSVVQEIFEDHEFVDDIKFTNIYKANATKEGEGLPLSAEKSMTGRPLEAEEFKFELYQTAADFVISGNPIQIKTNDGSGKVEFEKLDYNELGLFYYVLVEQNGALGGITYDETRYHITIEVTDKWDGYYTANVISIVKSSNLAEVQSMAFENRYQAAPTEEGIIFEAVKVLNGKTLQDKQFKFALYSARETYHYGGVALQIVENDAEGRILFDEIHYEEAGDYYYIVKELNDNQANITYDGTEYRIHVSVADDYAGHLSAEVVSVQKGEEDALKIEFKNVYTKPEDPTPVIVPPNTSDPTAIASWSTLSMTSLLLAVLLMLLKKKEEQEI